MGWRRRYCPSPVLVALVVVACVFYHSMTPLWRRTCASPDATCGSTTDNLGVTNYSKICLYNWTCLYRKLNEFGESVKNHVTSRTKKRAFLHVHPSVGNDDTNLYKHILAKLGYKVISVDGMVSFNRKREELYQDMVIYRDAFIYIPSNTSLVTNCMEKRELAESLQMRKVNVLPAIQKLLCRKDRICDMAAKCPGLQNLPLCSTFGVSRGETNAKFTPTHDTNQAFKTLLKESPDVPLIRAFVLVTSISPLRAFIHSSGIVRIQTNRRFVPIKLQAFCDTFFNLSSSFQSFNTVKETISKLLLTAEILSEVNALETISFKRCKECSQLLTFDIGYSSSLDPVVLEVKEHFQFESVDLENKKTKELILEDAFKFILHNKPNMLLKGAQTFSYVKKDICWKNPIPDLMLEGIHLLFQFAQELTSLGEFEMLYPSTSSNLGTFINELYLTVQPMQKLVPILTMHCLLADMLAHFQKKQTESTNTSSTVRNTLPEKAEEGQLSFTDVNARLKGDKKQKTCSNEDDTQSHIRNIFSNPPLDLTPPFSPRIKDYYAEVPFDVVTVEIGAEAANCKSQVHLDEREGLSVGIYPLGLGPNQITIHVTDDSKPSTVLLRSYRITVSREDRPSLPLFDQYKMCGFIQDCGLIIHSKEPCGLQPLSAETLLSLFQAQQRKCESGDAKGQWIVPCLSCTDNRTCDWRAISWQPYNCQHPVLLKNELQQCLKERKILFIGDSTNRGMMYYLMERLNETLQEWQKSHDMKFYNNINNGKTFISYSYYPQFWINVTQRPTFEKALEQLIERSHPLENSNRTVLVVGGVQWINPNHLQIINKVLKRQNLSNILTIIKSIGMGFHLPVQGIRSLSLEQIKKLFDENILILKGAKVYGFEVVDTFSITMGRYKEFLQGKCGCHFHEPHYVQWYQ
ncbi:cadherin-like and PC-esterase domain-containing protein 1 [Bombina bombina]|uniref:cadherin-like and PC-esterase domain-containing protein 1 n=1 Tax=Bombina bombina TaxID=8345 RepID=UPI00235ADED7|nr:cadherin-like and PC-esterase domain-containing protein 1 [Bombina bombina]